MVLTLAILVAQFRVSNDPRRDFAAGKDEAVFMLPPTTVCDGQAMEYQWTSDGSHLVVTRNATDLNATDLATMTLGKPPTPDLLARTRPRCELIVWNLKSRKATTLMTIPSPGNIGGLEAMTGTDRILLQTTQQVEGLNGAPNRTVQSIVMVATGTKQLFRLSSDSGGTNAAPILSLSSIKPLGALQWRTEPGKPSLVRFFGPAGSLGANIYIPEGAFVFFDKAGLPGYLYREMVKGKNMPKFQALNPANGRLGAITTLDFRTLRPEGKAEFLTAEEHQSVVEGGSPAPTVVLRVKDGKREEDGVVSSDGNRPVLSPRFDAIAYSSQGVVTVRSLAKVPRTAYDQALLQKAKMEALSRAKQVGLGFLMYAGDMDDVLPGRDADIRQLIGPYVKNNSLFDGFSYTFGGGSLTDVEKPAETEMGYVTGPGGRAVIYVDGHAKWIPDLP